MTSNGSVVPLRQPNEIEDPLTAVLRNGARRLLAQAIEAEAEAFLAAMNCERLPDGRSRRRFRRQSRWNACGGASASSGTGMGRSARFRPGSARSRCSGQSCATVASAMPASASASPRPFCGAGLGAHGAWMRCCLILYLRGVSMSGEPLGSTCDFQEALGALLGKDAPNLSPSVIARLRGEWEADYARWQRRDLSARRYVLRLGRWRLPASAHGAAGRVPDDEGVAGTCWC